MHERHKVARPFLALSSFFFVLFFNNVEEEKNNPKHIMITLSLSQGSIIIMSCLFVCLLARGHVIIVESKEITNYLHFGVRGVRTTTNNMFPALIH